MTYIQPLLFIFLAIATAGLLLIPRSWGKRLAIAGVIGIFLSSWPPADWLFSRPLEGQYPVRPFKPTSQLPAIVGRGESVQAGEGGHRSPGHSWGWGSRRTKLEQHSVCERGDHRREVG